MKIPYKVIVADSACGGDPKFLAGLKKRRKSYVVNCPVTFEFWSKGNQSRVSDVPIRYSLSLSKPNWREGSKGWLRRKFVAIRVYCRQRGL